LLGGEPGGLAALAGDASFGTANNLASHVFGRTIENHDGQELGSVRDFIIDWQSGRIKYAIVSSYGFLGLVAQTRIVPASALSEASANKHALVLDVSVSGWEHAPRFRRHNLAAVSDPVEAERIAQFYGQLPQATPASAEPGSKSAQGPLAPTGRESGLRLKALEPAGRLELASDFIGGHVTDFGEAGRGKVSDLLVDFSGQKPVLALVSTRRFFETRPAFVVPIRFLSKLSDGELVMDATAASFEHAQPFDMSAWASANASHEPIYRYVENFDSLSKTNGTTIAR
jgi:sporulation protein YlmC with PRC-barrel domain